MTDTAEILVFIPVRGDTNHDVEIVYLEEDKPLGNGGGLGLLSEKGISGNTIVMNGEPLTTLSFR